MKKSTLLLWAIIFGGIALLIVQNQAFFLADQSLRLDLGFTEEYQSPVLPVAVTVFAFFFAGIIIAYLFNFPVRFKARRTIKKLNATMASHSTEMAELKREIDALKGTGAATEAPATAERFELSGTQQFTSDTLVANPADPTDAFPAAKSDEASSELGKEDSKKE